VIVGVAATSDPDARAAVPIVGLVMVLVAAFLFVIAVANVLVGWGLLRLAEWARITAIVLGFFRLISFPIGTVVGALIIWYMVQPQTVAVFRAARSGQITPQPSPQPTDIQAGNS
jgi:hypothetical protein